MVPIQFSALVSRLEAFLSQETEMFFSNQTTLSSSLVTIYTVPTSTSVQHN